MRSKNSDELVLANKYFEKNKSQAVFEDLQRIIENGRESDDLRLQAAVYLRKYYNFDPKYIRYKNDEEEEEKGTERPDKIYALPEATKSKSSNRFNADNFAVPISIESSGMLIDSLAYLDTKDDLYYKEEANRLIKEELDKEIPTKDYLEKLQYPDMKFMKNPLIKSEFDRIKNNDTLSVIKGDYKTKFEAPAPNKYRDEKNWKNLLNQISISSQNLNIKSMNLELITKYGPLSWKKYMSKLDQLIFVKYSFHSHTV